jgi:hypothetical protein
MTSSRTLVLIVAALAAVTVGVPLARALPPTPPSKSKSVRVLAKLTVASPASSSGYARSKFHTWDTVSGTCNTRETVLKRDGVKVETDSQCRASTGTWTSYYDGIVFHDAGKLDIDHVVPLENAWISGARSWSSAKREWFANDLSEPQLIAVSASSNRSKGDRSPDAWKPPRRAAWCLYARWWIDVKSTWKLTITTAEHDALAAMLTTC